MLKLNLKKSVTPYATYVFKPLYWIEKKIDPSYRSDRPKYKKFARFFYKVAKWSL